MSTELYPGIAFSPQAVLAGSIGAADTIIPVSDVSAFPEPPNLATIGTDEEGETILYTAKTADALSGCQRGVEGTARAWMAGEMIGRNFTAKDHADLIAAVETILGQLLEGAEVDEAGQLILTLKNGGTMEAGRVVGPKGTDGKDGKDGQDGKSAYAYAAEDGYPGDEEAFGRLMGTGPWLPLSGGTVTGPLVTQVPTEAGHAANKKYVDDLVGDIGAVLDSINGEVV